MNKFYFTVVFIVSATLSLHAEDKLPATIDVSGNDGEHAVHGKPDYDPSARHNETGDHGSRGGHAGQSTPGEHSKHLEVTLSRPVEGAVELSGSIISADGRKKLPIKERFTIGQSGNLHVNGSGGRGGNGGKGGDGQGGDEGTRGNKATEFFRGTNGGPGGNGGDGGNGSPGSNGGNGSNIVVKVPLNILESVQVITHNVSPGAGGDLGKNGRGGERGPGGPGGAPYSKQVKVGERPIKDAQGNVIRTEDIYETRTKAGGEQGDPGRRGDDGTGDIRGGNPGRIGSFKFVVTDENGKPLYEGQKRLTVELVDYQVVPEGRDGIYEPDRNITIEKLTIKNIGDLPLPPHARMEIYLNDTEWVTSTGEPLLVPGELHPGKSHTFKNQVLTAKLKDVTIKNPGERFTARADFDPESMIRAGVNRPFDGFEHQQSKTVQFPTYIGEPRYLPTITPKEGTMIEVDVYNDSDKPLGPKSELMRSVRLDVRTAGGDIELSQLVFMDENKDVVSLNDAFIHAMAELPAKSMTTVRFYLGFKEGITPQSHLLLRFNLELTRFDNPKTFRLAQIREIKVQSDNPYGRVLNSTVLFGSNHGTEKKEVASWNKLFQVLGMISNNFNTTYQPKVDLDDPQKGGTFTLYTDMKYGVVVIPNNEFLAAPEQYARSLDLLSERDHFMAAGAYDIGFLVLGNKGIDLSAHLAQPEVGDEDRAEATRQTYERRDDLVKARSKVPLYGWDIKDENVAAYESNSDLPPIYHLTPRNRLWYRSKEKHIKKEAVRLQQDLEKAFPTARFFVVYDFKPEVETGFLKKRGLGTIHVFESLDRATNSLVQIPATDAQMHDPSFIQSEDVLRGFFLAMTFERKLRTLSFLRSSPVTAFDESGTYSLKTLSRILNEAITYEVVQELYALNRSSWTPEFFAHFAAKSIKRLNLLSTHATLNLPNGDLGIEILVDLFARLKLAANQLVPWYADIVPYAFESERLADGANRLISSGVKKAFAEYGEKNANAKILARYEELKAHARGRSGFLTRKKIMAFLSGPFNGINSSAEVLTAEQLVVSQRDWDKNADRLKRKEQARQNVAKAKLNAQNAFNVKFACPQMLSILGNEAEMAAPSIASRPLPTPRLQDTAVDKLRMNMAKNAE